MLQTKAPKKVSRKKKDSVKSKNILEMFGGASQRQIFGLTRDIYSIDLPLRMPNINVSQFPSKAKLVVDAYVRLNSIKFRINAFPIYVKLFVLCYFCYGLLDRCEQCKTGAGAMCSVGRCIRFVCNECKCSHGKK